MGFILATLAVQFGSALYNSYRSNIKAKEIALRQQALEEKILLEGIDLAKREFAELCSLQRELESKMHNDRIELIKHNHQENLRLDAYGYSLENWPLMAPPYVIKCDCLYGIDSNINTFRLPINCIMTTSMNSKFNLKIFPQLEEEIAEFCSKYWNVNFDKSIRFFQDAWRNNAIDLGSRVYDLHAHLRDVPTLVLSPIIKNKKLLFRFHWWGVSLNPNDVFIEDVNNEFDPELNVVFDDNFDYLEQSIKDIIQNVGAKLKAFISYFADLYYWNFYSDNFLLPKLIEKDILCLPFKDKTNYCQEYSKLICEYIDKKKHQIVNNDIIIENINSITSIDNKSSVLSTVFEKISNVNHFLAADDVLLIQTLEGYYKSSQQKTYLKEIEKSLEKKETISIYPCADEGEIYYNITQLSNANNDGKKLFIRFISKNAFIAALANDGNDLIFANRSSRFHLFIFDDKTIKHKQNSFVFMIETARVANIDEKINPVYNLSVTYESLAAQINNALSFLNEAHRMYESVYPAIKEQNYHYPETNTFEIVTEKDITNWIKSNYKEGNEFILTISYDKQNKVYVYFGCFSDEDNVYDNIVFISTSKYLDRDVYKMIKNKCVYKFKIEH